MRRTLALLLFAIAGIAQTIDRAALDSIIEDTRKAFSAPGVAVAVVKDDATVYAKGFGLRKLGAPEPVTPDTRMAIGSTSKAFTTAAMAILVDEKKMDWDDPVRKHLPYFRLSDPLADANVTMRDIVCHRTGYSRHDALWYRTTLSREEIIRKLEFIPLTKPFRSLYQYQNIMFLSAGESVGRIAGGTWEDFVAARLFAPLGMTNSDFSVRDLAKASDAAAAHVKRPSGEVEAIPYCNIDNIAPAGSINSSVRDLSNWVRMHLSGGMFGEKRVVSAKQIAELHAPQTVVRPDATARDLNPANQMSYGLGWMIQDYRGHHMVSHGGAIDGFRAQVTLMPEEKLGVVVLANLGGNNMPEALRYAIVDSVLGLPKKDWNTTYLAAAAKQEAETEKRRAEEIAKRKADATPSRGLAAYAGAFESKAYGPVKVVESSGKLSLEWAGWQFGLSHWHYNTFMASAPSQRDPSPVLFVLGTNGNVRAVEFLGQEFGRKETKE
ncbi:MAG: serine hydrolase [Bryobacteraceae bacterium]